MRTSLLFIALSFTLIFAQENGFAYVSGRSGDILIRPKSFEDKSRIYLINSNVSTNSFEDQTYADLVSHLLGGPIINSEVSRSSFPSSSLFSKASGNVLFVIDSLDSDIESQFSDLKMLKLSGKSLKLEKTSYPQDSIASLATLSSGFSPSIHGITGSSWASYLGQISAYRAGALPFVQNLADSFSQTYEGKSLIYSSSSNFQMTAAFAVNQFVHFPFNNEIGLYYNAVSRRFESIYTNSIETDSLLASASNITKAIGRTPFAMPGSYDTLTFDETSGEYTIKMVSKNLEAVVSAQQFTFFFAELQSVRNLIESLQNDANLKTISTDEIPDLFTFSFDSLKVIERRFGRDAPEFKIALYLIDEAVAAAIKSFSSIYSNKIAAQIIFLAKSADRVLAADVTAMNNVYSKVASSVRKDIFQSNFPSIYLNERADRDEVCASVMTLTDYDVYCANPFDSSVFPSLERWPDFYNQTTNGTHDAAIYQICLWFPIILIAAIFATVIAMCCMDVGADSMIYRSTNIRHQHAQ